MNNLDIGFAGTAPQLDANRVPTRFDDSYVKESFVNKVSGGMSSN